MGWWVQQRWSRGFAGVLGGALLAHVVILGFGWLRLAGILGAAIAFATGVLPFLSGGVIKSFVAAGAWVLIPRPIADEGEGADFDEAPSGSAEDA